MVNILSKKCQLCKEEKDHVEHNVGAPVSMMCAECQKIIRNWEDAKKAQHELWRQANGVDEPIPDEDGLGEKITEVEILLAEMKRILLNVGKTSLSKDIVKRD